MISAVIKLAESFLKLSAVYSKVRDLPESMQRALASVGYGRADIEVEPSETFTVKSYATGAGRRSFCIVINLETGEEKRFDGSWGGSNMFNPGNAVDMDETERPLPPGFAVIKGSTGDKVFARIELNPENVAKFLPIQDSSLSDRDKWLLYTFDGLTSAGRKDEWSRCRDVPSEDDLNRLAAMGYLKRSSNGATKITTEGKNALNRRPGASIKHPNSKW